MNNVKYKNTPLGELPFDWSTQNIEDVCEILDSKRVPLNKQEREAMQGDIPYYGANGVLDFIDKNLFDEPLILMAEDGGYFSEYNTRPIAYKISGKSWVNNHAHILKPLENEVFDWVYYNLVHKNILPFINGGTRAKLNQKDLKKLPIAYPPIKEQQKIAAILSSVDEAIEKTEQIIEQTETVKKGLMQELLTKGIGHTEFKALPFGKIPSTWKTVSINDVADINPENLSSKTDDDYELEYIDIASIENNSITETSGYLFKDAPSRARRKVKSGDIIVSTVRPYLRGFAYINEKYNEAVCSTGFAVLRSNNECYSNFLYQVILSERFVNYLISNMTGSNYPAVKADDIKVYEFALPPKGEQIKISNILSVYQNKIESELNKLTKLNKIKKGLMQQLLTGKVRVPIDEKEEVPS